MAGPVDSSERERVQRAKRTLASRYSNRSWYRGVGVVPRGTGLGLRLNVAPDANDADLTGECDGIPVEIVRIAGYDPRTSD